MRPSNGICIINQPAGLGDIFCCLKIAKNISERYKFNIIWPVISEYNYISQYLQYNDIWFVDEVLDFPYKSVYKSGNINIIKNDEFIYLPLRTSSRIYNDIEIFKSKYKLANLEYSDWSSYFNFSRNLVKEDILFYDNLKLKDDDNYIVVNNIFASPPNSQVRPNMNIQGKDRVIYMDYIKGFTPFDWCKVLENANEIHMVDTCYSFLLEKLTLNSDNVNIYSRFITDNTPSFTETQWLFSKKFNWVHR